MRVDRFKGDHGMAFIGSPITMAQTAEIHMYGHRSHPALMDTFKIEDIVAAVNALPGVTATYTPPEPPLPELPKAIGSVITSRGRNTYVRVSDNDWYSMSTGRFHVDADLEDAWLRDATIKEGPGA